MLDDGAGVTGRLTLNAGSILEEGDPLGCPRAEGILLIDGIVLGEGAIVGAKLEL